MSMFNIAGILLALIIAETARASAAPAGIHSPIAAGAAVLLVGIVAWWMGHGAVSRLHYYRHVEQAMKDGQFDPELFKPDQLTHQLGQDRNQFMLRMAWMRLGLSALEIGAFAALCWAAGWTRYITEVLRIPQGLAVLPLMMPYVGMLVAGWIGYYRVEVELRGRAWGLWSYLGHHTRTNLMLLAPIVAIQAAWWSIKRVFPAVNDAMESFIYLEFVGSLTVVFIASLFLPVLIRWVLPTKAMARGPLRERLEHFARERGVRVANIFVWRTGSTHFTTAFLIGLIAPFRYVFITDALLRHLNEDEVEAVFAHELGHARHHHLWGLLAFLVGFAVVWMGFDAASMLAGGTALTAILGEGAMGKLQFISLALALSYGYFSFGYISRRLERQADFYAARHTSPKVMASALLHVGQVTGHHMYRHGWRHFSIEQRVRELMLLEMRPEYVPVMASELKRGVIGVLIATALAIAVLVPSVHKDVVTGLASYSFTQFDRERVAPQRDPERLEMLRVRTLDRMHTMAGYDEESKFFARWYTGVMETLAGTRTDAFDMLASEVQSDLAKARTETDRAYAQRMLQLIQRGEKAAEQARKKGTRFIDEFERADEVLE